VQVDSLGQRHPALSVKLMHDLLEELGRDGGSLLRAAGIGPAVVDDPLSEVTRLQELSAVEHLVEHTQDVPGVALTLGRRYRIVTAGAFGLGMLTARTLRHALRLGVAYQRLTSTWASFAIRPVEGPAGGSVDAGGSADAGGEMEVLIEDEGAPAHLRAFVVERDLAAVVALFDDAWGARFPFTAATTRLTRPPHADRYAEVLGVPVTFAASAHALRFPTVLLERPLPQGTAAMQTLYERRCQALLERMTSGSDLVARVLGILVRGGSALPSLTETARELALSERTLRRRLADEGTSFGALVVRVQTQLAVDLLADTDLSVEEVAAELGYAEIASFSRAFRRWTGQPPSAFRQQTRRAARPTSVGPHGVGPAAPGPSSRSRGA
jgi:AraC-like DNA-binding protein